ncbi:MULTISPECIES: major facilitator superfamily domain-containing protein 6 [unclassified Caulobacter]|uniref:MFS transporter n=1 Tax=unclassified Caulobacter TaxID=2648921 RepID=UPI0006FAB01A|nr:MULTISPECIES: major facilitator superfamily domain-containing protein 6 [unclassified Caulobacter]KQV56818.1 MFS transporter [Caulobacter sp. Root342]KQV72457.1 MFS transporter [Caulobacter sp. Root343]
MTPAADKADGKGLPTLVRLCLFYAAIYLSSGVSLPYIGTYLRSRGMTGGEIGLILAVPLLLKPFTGPVLAVWADGFTLRRTPMVLLLVGAGLGYAGLLASSNLWWLILAWFVGQTLLSTVSPLIDVITLRRARTEGFNYGVPRGTGSSAFIAANLAMGAILTFAAPTIIAAWIAVACLVGAAAAALAVPPERVHAEGAKPARSERWKGLGDLVRDRTFVLAVVTAGLIQGAHAFYYGFSAILWRKQGISEPMIGVLWGVGVAAEVGFMWFLEPLRRRWGPERFLILGAAAAVLRWTCYAFEPPLWALFPLQSLHAMTFAASFLASLRLIEKLTPPTNASAAQAINSALSSGFTLGVATLCSGPLFDAFGPFGYLAVAAMALLGLGGAILLNRRAGRQIV